MVWTTKPPLGTQLDWANPLNQGLVGFWVFNEGMGDKVNDLSGNANTGTLTSMAFPSTTISGWNPGRLGPAIAFDGVNDYVDTGNSASLSVSINFTLEVWIKPATVSRQWQAILVKGAATGSTPRAYAIYLNYDEIQMNWYNLGWWAFTTTTANLQANNWYHIVYRRDSTNEAIYVNGILSKEQAWAYSVLTDNENLKIGWNLVYSDEIYQGIIDEVRIYNRVLSASEIMELYINSYGMFLELGCPEILCTLDII